MKKLYILLFVLLAGLQVQAQDKNTKRADKLFDQQRYVDAGEAYEKALKRGSNTYYVYHRLGDSYYNTREYRKASNYYGQAVKKASSDELDPEMVYRYVQSLKAEMKYDKANEVMQKFVALKPNDSRSVAFRQNPDYVQDIQSMQKKYEVESSDFNSEQSDFAANREGDVIYFSSARNSTRGTYQWTKQPYLDIYTATINDETNVSSEPQLLEGDVNSKYHEGTLAITPDGQYMFFTRVNYFDGDFEKSSEGVAKLNIYRARKVGGEWTDISETSINNDEYSVGHPTITKDGNTIYFASSQPGGMGGSDIYMASLTDGKIGEPQAVSGVNTAGDDSFPYISPDGTLYFTSTGHLGLGGQDIFMAEAKGNGFGNVTNMGEPINSSYDDFAFTFDSETGKGFMSTNRKGGQGSDDIFHVMRIEKKEVELTIMVVDAETGDLIEEAVVSVSDDMDMSFPNKQTDPEGKVEYVTDQNKNFVIRVVMDGYDSNEMDLAVGTDEEKTVTVQLTPEPIIEPPLVTLNEIKFDYDESDITPEAAIELDRLAELMKLNPDLRIKAETHADIRGSEEYNMALTKRRARSVVQYLVGKGINKLRITAEAKGESEPVYDCTDGCTEEEYQASRRSEFFALDEDGMKMEGPLKLKESN